MPISEGKKVEPVSVKFNAEQLQIILDLAVRLDRGKSYIVRELALRGLAQYMRDGSLKITAAEEQIISGTNKPAVTGKNKLKTGKLIAATGELQAAKGKKKKDKAA